jgi:DNA-binding CsgD family transcriptional regulator
VNHALARNREDPVPWGVGDPERPTAEWLRTFVEGNALWGDWARYRETPFYQHVLRRIGIDDHLRLLVYRGERFIGWIGAVRGRSEPHFTAGERRALQPLVEPVAAALVAADAAERDMRAQLGDAELVVRPDGSPEYASSAVRHWLGDRTMRPRLERLTRIIDQGFGERELWLDGTRVRWTRLAGVGGALRYLLHLDTVPAVYRHPDSCLTPAQREVGQLASAGLSSTEVARQLGVSAETVRTHLRQVYRRLGISTRTELTRVMGS